MKLRRAHRTLRVSLAVAVAISVGALDSMLIMRSLTRAAIGRTGL